jgi:hypothetical protein
MVSCNLQIIQPSIMTHHMGLNLSLKLKVGTWDGKIFFPLYVHASKTQEFNCKNEYCTNKTKNKHGDECEHSISLWMIVLFYH